MRRWGGGFLSFGMFALLGLMLLSRFPVWSANFHAEGGAAPRTEVEGLGGERISLPLQGPHVVVFWATWCGPCRVELARLQRMVEAGALAPEAVVAVAWGEPRPVVAEHARKRRYTFKVALDPSGAAAKAFDVRATPTLVLVDGSQAVAWKTTGLSPSLELRLGRYLGNH